MYNRIRKNRSLLNRVVRDFKEFLEELDPHGYNHHQYPLIIKEIVKELEKASNRVYSFQCLMAVQYNQPMPKLESSRAIPKTVKL